MSLYETGFLISPFLSEEEAEAIIAQMADIISQKNGKMVKQEKWGKRKMAYSIKKASEAYYVFFHYEGDPDIPLELGRRFRQMDTVLRYLTLNKDGKENFRKKKKEKGKEPFAEEGAAERMSDKGGEEPQGEKREKSPKEKQHGD
ncbi:MAG: 30S ribosomal protein S6 [Candidatus Aminicenantales bacterium]